MQGLAAICPGSRPGGGLLPPSLVKATLVPAEGKSREERDTDRQLRLLGLVGSSETRVENTLRGSAWVGSTMPKPVVWHQMCRSTSVTVTRSVTRSQSGRKGSAGHASAATAVPPVTAYVASADPPADLREKRRSENAKSPKTISESLRDRRKCCRPDRPAPYEIRNLVRKSAPRGWG